MRSEKDSIGKVSMPVEALYGIDSFRAQQNFPSDTPFPIEWYKATGTVKLACYRTVHKLLQALHKEHPDPIETANIFQSTNDVIPTALTVAAMQLLNGLEETINDTRISFEQLETKYRNALRRDETNRYRYI